MSATAPPPSPRVRSSAPIARPRRGRRLLAAALAGLAAMNLVEVLIGAITPGVSAWAPFQRSAALLGGEAMLEPDAPLAGTVAAALVVQVGWGLLFAAVLDALVARAPLLAAIAFGLAFGMGLYVLEFFAFARMFSWLGAARGLSALAGHVAFGGVAAAALARSAQPRPAPHEPLARGG